MSPPPDYDLVIIACGGRDFTGADRVYSTLDAILLTVAHSSRMLLIQGGARGADALAKSWAISRNVPMEEFKADWDGEGKSAGPERNKRQLKRLLAVRANRRGVVGFNGGSGTAHMKGIARDAGVKVMEA